MNDETRKEVLGEALFSELQAIHELVEDVPEIKHGVSQLAVDMTEVKDRLEIVAGVVHQHSRDITELKRAR